MLRSLKDHLQLWRMGNHISGLESMEAQISAEDVDSRVGVEEVAGATEAIPGCNGDGAQGGGKVGDTSGDRLSDLNSEEGGRPADVLGRANAQQQPGVSQMSVLSEPEGDLGSAEDVDSGEGWGTFAEHATEANTGCGDDWAQKHGKVGDMAGNSLSGLNSEEGGTCCDQKELKHPTPATGDGHLPSRTELSTLTTGRYERSETYGGGVPGSGLGGDF